MKKTTLDLIILAGSGTSLIISATEFSTADLIQIAGSVGLHDGHLTIINTQAKPTHELLQIISVYPKSITLNLSSISEV